MSKASKTECSRSAVPSERFAKNKHGVTESVNFPPVTSVVRPYNGWLK